ncbi:hypothetical protein CONPUDRAFT_75654 [Coniophora puteana RWD-64-598 SS2]|uniref:Uncharacterized protein n=1 Tax=Coniophora puteana (strain RWD-64-598) TaxID=741705 RepID=A0A5M3MF99_CONPW|nr:uncharacterized protein CONPUDRAFT_75654 [Coniophora puteana RWD-64-598 SS2]EIW77882.1 hypothetical protein CONPUDRAFT_75654 [Coniophora puteana RWD-64-598 SS2]
MTDIEEIASTDGPHVGQKRSASPDSFPQGEDSLRREIKRLRAEKSSLEVKCQVYTDLILRFHSGDSAGPAVPTPAPSSTVEKGPHESLREFAKQVLNLERTGADKDSGLDLGCAEILIATDYPACADTWTSIAWDRHQTKQKSLAIVPAAEPIEGTHVSSRGRIYHGYNDNYKWMVNKDGVPVDGCVALAVLRTARLIFSHWRRKNMLAPTFLNLPYEAICTYTCVIEKIHPVLKLAGDHWKSRLIATQIYPSEADKVFKSKNGAAKATKTEPEDDSDMTSGQPGASSSFDSAFISFTSVTELEQDTGDNDSSSDEADDQSSSTEPLVLRSRSIACSDASLRAAPAKSIDAVSTAIGGDMVAPPTVLFPPDACTTVAPAEPEDAPRPQAEPATAGAKDRVKKGRPGPPSAPMGKPPIGSGKSLWCDRIWWPLLGTKPEGTTARFNADWKALSQEDREVVFMFIFTLSNATDIDWSRQGEGHTGLDLVEGEESRQTGGLVALSNVSAVRTRSYAHGALAFLPTLVTWSWTRVHIARVAFIWILGVFDIFRWLCIIHELNYPKHAFPCVTMRINNC